MEKFKLIPIGRVHKDSETFLEIYPEFAEALEGLNEGDWIKLILWLHESDTPEKRKILKVHPHNNPENPLKGVFATRSPVRPNPLAIYAFKIHRIERNRLYVDWIDANDGTPIVDIKILVERFDCPREMSIDEQELDIPSSRKSESLHPKEISPEKYNALVLELGSKTTILTAKELVELIRALKEFYDRLPIEIKDKLKLE